MEELIKKKPKMKVSIAVNDCVDFAIKFLLKTHGISQRDFVKWGGRVDEVVRPSNPHRREGIVSGKLDMVIDEGMDSWGDVAVEHGMKFLSYSEPVLQKLEKFGFQRARVDGGRVAGINEPTTVVDFSGWPIVVHEKFPMNWRITSPVCWIRFAKRFRTTRRKPRPCDRYAPIAKPGRWIFRSIPGRRGIIGRRGTSDWFQVTSFKFPV